MGRFLAAFVTVAILLLSAAFVVPAFVDWNAYRPVIAEAASAALGQKIDVAGDIEIALLPEPHVRAGKVSALLDAPGNPVLKAEMADISLSLQALFSGTLEASAVKLVKPFVTLDVSSPRSPAVAQASSTALPLTATIASVSIEGGRLELASGGSAASTPAVLSRIDGVVSSQAGRAPYRFSGHAFLDAQEFDIKAAASLAGAGLRLTGTATDVRSRTALQADGVINAATGEAPTYTGGLSLTVPKAAIEGPFDLQAKANVKASAQIVNLADLMVTADVDGREDVLIGEASLALPFKAATIALNAASLTLDGPSGSEPAATHTASLSFLTRLPRIAPDWKADVTWNVGRLRVNGDDISDVKLKAARTKGQWLINEASASFPGESHFTFTGRYSAEAREASGSFSGGGKNLLRFARFTAQEAKLPIQLSPKAFELKGNFAVSDRRISLDGVSGNLDGDPFTGAFGLETGDGKKSLRVNFSGQRLDASALPFAAAEQTPSSGTGPSLLAPSLKFGETVPFDEVELDLAAAVLTTTMGDAKEFAVRLKATRDLLSLSRLNVETSEGLIVRGQGTMPWHNGPGRLEGHIEIRTPAALVQLASFTSLEAVLNRERGEGFLPAVFSVAYSAEQALDSNVTVSGNGGGAKIDGSARLHATGGGPVEIVSGLASVTAVDGTKLLNAFWPEHAFTPGASLAPGVISAKFAGSLAKLEGIASLRSGPLQAEVSGSVALQGLAPVFTGKLAASSQTPEAFLPPPALAFLGGEPKASLRLDCDLTASLENLEANNLRAETPKNKITGRIQIDGNTRRADIRLSGDTFSFPGLMSPLLNASKNVVFPDTSPLWNERSFDLDTLKNASAVVAISAKTLKISETMAASDAGFNATLDRGKLEVRNFEAGLLGGEASASFIIDARGNLPTATMRIALARADFANLASPGVQPLWSGKVSAGLSVFGAGLSPRAMVASLKGRGQLALAEGQLVRFSSSSLQKTVEDLIALPQPPNEDAMKNKLLEASLAGDSRYRALKIPIAVRDGTLELRRASFRGRDAPTLRMEAALDLDTLQADTVWQVGVISDRRSKWPPVKILIASPIRDLGRAQRSIDADDLFRALRVKKMEGDLSKLENLNKGSSTASPWATTQESAAQGNRRRGNEPDRGASATPMTATPPGMDASEFEARMRDAVQAR